MSGFLARRERFERVSSTNDVVREWLAAGTPEVALAVAAEQTAGRGREGRAWIAPPDAALLLSLGFRPDWLAPDAAWRLAAVASLAMASAGEDVAELPFATIRLKWPNDLVIASGPSGDVRKLAGVLGETDGLGTADPRVVVGVGMNVDWPADAFPADLASSMTSLREANSGRPVDREALLEAFIERLGPRVEALRAGRFEDAEWTARQSTTGRAIRLETVTGHETVQALGVDPETGALIVEDLATASGERRVLVGDVMHLRLAEPIVDRV